MLAFVMRPSLPETGFWKMELERRGHRSTKEIAMNAKKLLLLGAVGDRNTVRWIGGDGISSWLRWVSRRRDIELVMADPGFTAMAIRDTGVTPAISSVRPRLSAIHGVAGLPSGRRWRRAERGGWCMGLLSRKGSAQKRRGRGTLGCGQPLQRIQHPRGLSPFFVQSWRKATTAAAGPFLLEREKS